MLAPVAPFDQVITPSQPVAVNVAEPPGQTAATLAVTTGAAVGVTVMV